MPVKIPQDQKSGITLRGSIHPQNKNVKGVTAKDPRERKKGLIAYYIYMIHARIESQRPDKSKKSL